ncbi:gamma-mobile-trio protein GmtX [Roseateles sp. PN1]|uniref:gamma-mobile-trio protein GmtX n=1 Tax=Roseateles sp. PN1 TaxID=3137372 RepID=UPI003139398E
MSSPDTGSTPTIEPEQLFTTLLATAKHPRKRRNLEALQDVCRKRFDVKGQHWTYTSIGKVLETDGLLTVQSLLQKQSNDYRALIDAWRMKAEASLARAPGSSMSTNKQWFDNIDDLWARQTAAALEREVIELRKKNALLEKWKGTVTIRIDGSALPESADTAKPPTGLLSVQEKRALSMSISPMALSKMQLSLGPQGELLNEDGVAYFAPGWASGLRKLLQALDA